MPHSVLWIFQNIEEDVASFHLQTDVTERHFKRKNQKERKNGVNEKDPFVSIALCDSALLAEAVSCSRRGKYKNVRR